MLFLIGYIYEREGLIPGLERTLLVPPKFKIIMVPHNYSFFQYSYFGRAMTTYMESNTEKKKISCWVKGSWKEISGKREIERERHELKKYREKKTKIKRNRESEREKERLTRAKE